MWESRVAERTQCSVGRDVEVQPRAVAVRVSVSDATPLSLPRRRRPLGAAGVSHWREGITRVQRQNMH